MEIRKFFARFVRRSAVAAAAAVFAVAAVAGTASAQFVSSARVRVPFSFTAGKVELPAGTYLVRRTAANMIVVRNEETDQTATLATNPLDVRAKSKRPALVFLRNDDGASLAQACWEEGSMSYRKVTARAAGQLAVIAAE